MVTTCHEVGERDSAGHSHRLGALVGRAVAELAVLAVPPAVRRATGSEPAGVIATRHEAGECLTTGYGHRGGSVVPTRAVAELPEVVVSPAVRGATGGEPAGVIATRHEAVERHPTGHRHRGQPVGRLRIGR